MKTSDIKAALKARYKTNEYALMWEVGDTTGSNVRRHADAVVMNLWPSRGLDIEGIEIKVSRSDWRRELAIPEKSEPIQRFCNKWWVVAPSGIVQLHELPSLWGLMEVNPNGAMRVIKAAPVLDPVPVTKGFVAAMLRRSSEMDEALVDSLVNRKLTELRKSDEAKIEREVASRSQTSEKALKALSILKSLGLYSFDEYVLKEFASTYRMGKQIKSTNLTTLQYTEENLRKAADAVGKIAASLAETSQENLDTAA